VKPIRVALSGSGFRLPAHLGALQAIVHAGYTIVELAGTSGGSIVAALYASGMPLSDMRKLCMDMDWSPMMRFSPWAALSKQALCTGNVMLEFLTEKTGGKTFADLDIDLKIIASDMVTQKEFQFNQYITPDAPIALAARASASIPIVFAPVQYGDAFLADGGMCDNIPAIDLTIDDAPRLGIYLVAQDPPLLPAQRGISHLAPRFIDLLLASNEATRVAISEQGGARIVRIETAYASSFDRNMARSMRQRLYDDGYAATTAALIPLPI
jgi:NTE family protein